MVNGALVGPDMRVGLSAGVACVPKSIGEGASSEGAGSGPRGDLRAPIGGIEHREKTLAKAAVRTDSVLPARSLKQSRRCDAVRTSTDAQLSLAGIWRPLQWKVPSSVGSADAQVSATAEQILSSVREPGNELCGLIFSDHL